jgi:hypothetical protein
VVDELEVAEEEVFEEKVGERYVNGDGRTRQQKVETMTCATKRQEERIVSGVVLVRQFA